MLRRPQRAPRRARPGDGEPRRHRPPDARRRDLDRDPRHRRRFRNLSAQVEAIELVLADGSLLEISSRPTRRRCRAARVGLGALGVDLLGDAAHRPRLHARTASTRRCRWTRRSASLDELRRRATTTSSSTSSPTPRSRSAARASAPTSRRARARRARLRCRRSCSRTGSVGLLALAGRRVPSLDPAAGAALAARQSAARARSTAATGSSPRERRVRFTEMEYAIPREHARRGGAPGARAARASAELAVGFPIEVRFVAADDALAQPGPRARDLLHRRPPGPAAATGSPTSARSRRIMSEYERPPALGQAPLPDRRDAGGALPALGDFQRVRARLDPEGRFSQRLHGPRPGPGRLAA